MNQSSLSSLVAALAAGALVATTALANEPLMPNGPGGVQPFDPNPAAAGSLTRQFMTYGTDADGNAIPRKTLRITNNTAETVYPIMRDPNSNVLASNPAIGLYNPYDPVNREYRGYIGYAEDGKYYFGLKAGQSILVSIPLVFWNGARIGIGTDGQFLAPVGLPNPLRYDPNSQRAIAPAETSPDTIANGVVMWYRAETPQAPNDDTEDQLAEWTIRDHGYLVNPQITARTNNEIPDSELVTLMNYDVSNVDNLYLPLAMAANDVWVLPATAGPGPNRTTWKPGSMPDVYGWTGATNSTEFLQTAIREFTAGNNQLLGAYFGGKGWPFYNIPNPTNDPNAPIKIPSGANIFAQSPIKGVPSSYGNGQWQNDKYMLSSGGTLPISATIGWAGGTPDPAGSTTLHLNLAEPDKLAFLAPGYLVTGIPPNQPPLPNPIQAGTTVVSVDKAAGTVVLSKPLAHPSADCAYQFSRPVSDYASEAMIRLWFSWAQYYLLHWRDRTPSAPTAPTAITGSIEVNTATLHFNEPHPELVEGMAVTGPGLDDAQTEKGIHQGDALILEIAGDKRSVILSQVVNVPSTNATFTVRPPQTLLWTPTAPGDPGYPLFGDQFQFGDEPAWQDPYEFSQAVYLVMAAMNQIGQPNNDSVSKFMQDVVGANMGFIFTNAAKKTTDAQMVIAMIRDTIKSVLRGVSDFTKYPDILDSEGRHLSWYPDPAEPRGGQPFNVFNLDPFVWFVHVRLGFSGYGFSIDDDTADVGAGGPSQLQLTVTGTGGLKNLNPWSIQAPYGPIKDLVLPYSGPASATNGDTLYQPVVNATNTTPIRVTVQVPHNLANGANILIEEVGGNLAANGTFKVGNVTRLAFDLFDAATGTVPVAGNGTYTSGGKWGLPKRAYIDTGADLAKVFYRVTGDDALGTFQGTFVSANGVVRDKAGVPFRVQQLGQQNTGRLILAGDLTDAFGNPLPAGNYPFTFFGVAEAAPAPIEPTTPALPNPAYLRQLGVQLTRLKQIEDPARRARALQSLRAWIVIVKRGVDPSSRRGQLLRRLVNARTIANPERRSDLLQRIRRQLDRLPGEA